MLLLDEMLAPAIADQLGNAGINTEAVCARIDLLGLPDSEVLEAAAREERILVTENIRDFVPLSNSWMAQGRTHAGIVLIASKTVPQGRGKNGAVVGALVRMRDAGELPAPGQMTFLRP